MAACTSFSDSNRKDFNLTYVISTYNKIEFIKIVLEHLISYRSADEEIVVVDGGSKDGTAEYLQELFNNGFIHQFVSEKDHGEGHGFNKAILMARGKIVKYLTDDDVFDISVIRCCKEYMLANPNINFLNTNGANYDIEANSDIYIFTSSYLEQMKEWEHTGKPFAFCMLGAMFNRKSLALLGLLNPSIKRADAEYSLRITSQKITMAWCTGVSYVRLHNSKSNSAVFSDRIKEETKKLNAFYNVSIDGEELFDKSIKGRCNKGAISLKEGSKNIIKPLYKFFKSVKVKQSEAYKSNSLTEKITISDAFTNAQQWLKMQAKLDSNEFHSNLTIQNNSSNVPSLY
jgi:glycosyltransferase involved in cell wall biosynthesis